MPGLPAGEEQFLVDSRRIKRSTITEWHPAASKLHLCHIWNIAEWDGPNFQIRREFSGILAMWNAAQVAHEKVCLGLSYTCG